jgi:hypothetical protein
VRLIRFAQNVRLNRALSWSYAPAHCRRITNMTPEEIVADLNARNRATLYVRPDCGKLGAEQVLALMDAAAMQGFRLGSNVALSMVQGALLVQLSRAGGDRRGSTA